MPIIHHVHDLLLNNQFLGISAERWNEVVWRRIVQANVCRYECWRIHSRRGHDKRLMGEIATYARLSHPRPYNLT